MDKKSSFWADQTGMALSILCALHCLGAPLLALMWPEDWFHWAMLALVLPVSGLAFYKGYQTQRNKWVLSLGLLGLSLLILAVGLPKSWLGAEGETWLTIAGAVLLWLGHAQNLRACQSRCRDKSVWLASRV